MEKIKVSELYADLIAYSQKAMAKEDPYLANVFSEVIKESPNVNYMTIIKLINFNNEFIRNTLIKAIVSTCVEHELAEEDIDINDINVANKILVEAVKNNQ